MRIACISSSWPSADNPSAGAFVLEHVELLRGAGHDVTVFTWRPGPFDHAAVSVAPLGRRSLFSGVGAPDGLEQAPWRVAEAPVAVAAMLRELRRHPRFDLYLGHWFVPGGLVARLAGDMFARPSAVIGHSGGIHAVARLPGVARRAFWRSIVRDGTTSVPSQALADVVQRPVDVIPMGFHPTGVRSSGQAVLCYGRLVELKGFDIALAESAGEDVHVVGAGPELGRLRELAPHATFWGWADASLKREVFPLCGRAMFPSRVRASGRHEGWPVSVLEVASAGIVPFVAAWPGAAELVATPAEQVVEGNWRRAMQVDIDPLRGPTVDHAARYDWDALRPRWLEWVECAALTR